MRNPGSTPTPLFELACLAHSIPGVSLRIATPGGDDLLVSASCLGADLDPCRLRAALLAARPCDAAWFTPERVEVVSGLVHLGGGLYQRSHPQAAAERWFVVALPHERILHLIAGIDDRATDEFDVTLRPDPELGLCAVRVHAAERAQVAQLDDVAFAVLATCLVDELISTACDRSTHRR